jgi:hypothetical protein
MKHITINVHNHFTVDPAPIVAAIDRLGITMSEQLDKLGVALGRINAATNTIAGKVGEVAAATTQVVEMERAQIAELKRLADLVAAGGTVTEEQLRQQVEVAEQIAASAEQQVEALEPIETALEAIANPAAPGDGTGTGTGDGEGEGTGEGDGSGEGSGTGDGGGEPSASLRTRR